MLPRFFVGDLDRARGTATLAGEEAHHAARVLRLREGDEVALFDAINSAGFLASEGSSACSAGRTSVEATPTGAARPITRISLPPSANAAAEPASAAAPTSAFATRNRSRWKRSPNAAAKGASSAAGSSRMRPAIPTA